MSAILACLIVSNLAMIAALAQLVREIKRAAHYQLPAVRRLYQ